MSPKAPDPLADRIGKNVFRLRESTGLTQERFASFCGIASERPISDYERGFTVPSLKSAMAIAQACGISIDYLVGNQPDAESREYPDSERAYRRSLTDMLTRMPLDIVRAMHGLCMAHQRVRDTVSPCPQQHSATTSDK